MHGEASSALQTAEVVHWITLGVIGVVYTLRVLWLLRFKAGKDRSPPGGEGRTSGGRHPVTPWGKPTKGARTRNKNKASQKLIIRSRHAKKKGR